MEHSRVAKFKQYRDSFIKSNSVTFDTKKSDAFLSTTNTLPYKDVMIEVDNQKELQIKKRNETLNIVFKFIALGAGVVVAIIGLVFLGILAFGGK